MSKKTIAIIGATGNMGSVFSKKLAGNYRLLLFDHNSKQLSLLANEIKNTTEATDIECMGCEMDASWEADVIITDVPLGEEKKMAEKIKQFTNRKIVVAFSDTADELQKLLTGTRIVKITDDAQTGFVINSNDEEALETITEIMQTAGFNPVYQYT